MPMVRFTADTKDTSRRRPTTGCCLHSDTRTSLSLRPSRNVLKNLCTSADTTSQAIAMGVNETGGTRDASACFTAGQLQHSGPSKA